MHDIAIHVELQGVRVEIGLLKMMHPREKVLQSVLFFNLLRSIPVRCHINAPHVLTFSKCIILLQALRRSRFHYYNVPDDHTPTQYKQQDASLCALDSLFLQGFTYVSKCVSELVLRVATAEYSDMRCAA